MSIKEFFMDYSRILSVVAIVISLIALIAKLRIGRRTIKAAQYQKATDLFHKITETLVNHPELRPYFYEGEPAEGVDERTFQKLMVVSEMMLDTFEWVLHDIKDAEESDMIAWRRYMKRIHKNSPILRYALKKYRNWYPLVSRSFPDKKR